MLVLLTLTGCNATTPSDTTAPAPLTDKPDDNYEFDVAPDDTMQLRASVAEIHVGEQQCTTSFFHQREMQDTDISTNTVTVTLTENGLPIRRGVEVFVG